MSPTDHPSQKRPLTIGQEALFFAVAFAVAVFFQFAVILKVASIADW